MSNFKITEMYAFLAVDETDGDEGVIGMTRTVEGRDVFMPFVCADKDRVDSLRMHAEKIGKQANAKIKLVKFAQREDLEVINE